jgi:hypothetical protein
MHIPSARVRSEMNSEDASLWFVPANEGTEIAALIKAPTTSIKALLARCNFEIVLGRDQAHLCAGIRIFDMPDAPILICGLQRHNEEHLALNRALRERRFPLFLFNEMDLCVAWTTVEITEADAASALLLVEAHSSNYVGPFGPHESHVLDCFVYTEDPTVELPGARKISTVRIPGHSSAWTAITNTFIGNFDHHTIIVDSADEGAVLENAVWSALESVFPLGLYKSPQVTTGNKTRELTDVLASYEYGCFLIEAKDMSVFQAGFTRSQARRLSGVQKQTKKAIAQLVGAANALARGDEVRTSKGELLTLARDKPPHCIVLITELSHTGDWSEVESLLVQAMVGTGGFFHLLDLREFIALLKGSSGKAALFDYNLMERCKVFVERKSVHIRSRPGRKSDA